MKTCKDELVLLDIDGTVVDIAPRPDAVVVEPSLKSSLRQLLAHDPHGLVLVTGRALRDADRLMAPLTLPALASHGAEARVAGTAWPRVPPAINTLRPLIENLMRVFPAAVIEWKPFSAAVHVRSAPEVARPVGAVLDAFARANRTYRIERGKQVFEIVPTGVSKAEAVRRLLRHLPYAGRHAIYIASCRRRVLLKRARALRLSGRCSRVAQRTGVCGVRRNFPHGVALHQPVADREYARETPSPERRHVAPDPDSLPYSAVICLQGNVADDLRANDGNAVRPHGAAADRVVERRASQMARGALALQVRTRAEDLTPGASTPRLPGSVRSETEPAPEAARSWRCIR